jgi:secreted trypsin-like serine protease
VAGDHDVRKRESEEQHIPVCSIKIHRKYDSSGNDINNDIALMKLCRVIRFTNFVGRIKLAPKELSMPISSEVTVAGWGDTKQGAKPSPIMRKVTVKTIQTATCRNAYNWITQRQLCAGVEYYGGKDSCQGDSGGSLWYEQSGKIVQVGIVSSGRGCAQPDFPGIYTNVGYYSNWIEENMKNVINQNDNSHPTQLPNPLCIFLPILFCRNGTREQSIDKNHGS